MLNIEDCCELLFQVDRRWMIVMKAAIINQYGHADELIYTDVHEPEVGAHDILIEIKATSVNPLDWKIREGYAQQILTYEFPLILGWDAAGVIKKIGSHVTKFTVGDEVYTSPDVKRNGTYAEYVAVDERYVAKKPERLSFEEAASIPLVGITSWQSLVDSAKVSEGDRVLIHAGAGGVGSFAIQLAKALGCWVATTTSGKNVDFLKQLGADLVINYEEEQFVDILSPVDVVFDTMGGEIQEQSYDVLKRGGRLVSIVDVPDEQTAKKYGVKVFFVSNDQEGDKLAKISELLDSGDIRPIVGKVMNLSEIQEAHRLSETKHMRGKIVLKV